MIYAEKHESEMEIRCECLDDVLMRLFPPLLDAPANNARRGATRELLGVSIVITNPRARLSRSASRGRPFSALGELLWYLTGSNQLDFIRPYIQRYQQESEDELTVRSGYGLRMFSMNGVDQVQNVVRLLEAHETTRRAVIQIFGADDLDADHKEVPCTTALQFLIRDGQLHLIATLRSNDAFMGLPHDVFCFTMLQEMIARRLGRAVGEYRHFVGSMHLYDHDADEARRYLDEGFQRIDPMPPMPEGDPFLIGPALLDAERKVRAGEPLVAQEVFPNPYWADLVRLLQVFWATGEPDRIKMLMGELHCPVYKTYLEARMGMPPRGPDTPVQPSLPI